MKFADYLSEEWRPSLGCTEPAAIAYATSMAASHQRGGVSLVRLVCDARTYKNCYSVGIPNSERRTGLLWTLAIGAHLADHSLGLRCFEQTDARTLQAAGLLLEQHGIHVEVDPGKNALFIDVTVVKETGTARVVLTREHTQVSRIEVDGREISGATCGTPEAAERTVRRILAEMKLTGLLELARSLEPGDRALLREGAELNIAMARHGTGLFPAGFIGDNERESPAHLSQLVAAGVFGRMSGEPLTVMSLAGSGNKGITVSFRDHLALGHAFRHLCCRHRRWNRHCGRLGSHEWRQCQSDRARHWNDGGKSGRHGMRRGQDRLRDENHDRGGRGLPRRESCAP